MPLIYTARQVRKRAALSAAVAAAVALALGLFAGSRFLTRDPRVLLASVAPQERPFSSRFTGGMRWSPAAAKPPSAARNGQSLNLRAGTVSYLAVAELQGPVPESPNVGELGAIGSALVLGGRIDDGVETLARSVAAEPQSPELLSDLGAALLARAEAGDWDDVDEDLAPVREEHDADVPAALEVIDQALEKAPALEEALFNRALALERLYLRASARQAWQRYLKVDARSPWAKEARERLAAVSIPQIPDPSRVRAEIAAAASDGNRRRLSDLVLRQRHLARRTVQEDLLPGWGDALLDANPIEAGRQLRAARAIAEEWEAQTTDSTLLAAVLEVESAAGRARETLARGHRAFGEAARAFAAFELDVAKSAVTNSLGAFPSSSPAVPWVRALRLACLYYESGDIDSEARVLLDSPQADAGSRGRALSIWGLWLAKRGDHPQALATYREAVTAYARTEEREPLIWVRELMGEAYGYMGASGLCWQQRRAATRDIGGLTDRKQAFVILLASAMLALAEQRPRAAADFLEEAVTATGALEPHEAVQAYLWRSRIRLALGDSPGAKDDFVRAATWYPRLGAIDADWFAPDLQLARGLLTRNDADAIEALSQAIHGFRKSGQLYRIPGVLLARAQARQRVHQYSRADEDLRQAAVLHEEQQGAGYPQMLWTAPLDEPDRLFDERVELALREGRADEAFRVAESARARALRANAHTTAGSSASRVESLQLSDVRSRLSPGTTMLFFAVVSDRVVQWRIERHRSSVITLSISPQELARAVSAFEADLKVGVWTRGTRELAMRLHSALIRPARLGSGDVVVVPDGQLHGLPFAALVNASTGRFLVEERIVTIAPSAGTHLNSRDRRKSVAGAPADAFVVGDPRVSTALFPGIRPLAGARQEARTVAALYPRRELLVGKSATRAAVVGSLGRHEVLHFAGHAVVNRANPERSSLPLADDPHSEGALLLGTEIASFDLRRTHTVVLSGCETAGGRVLAGEGPLSLAHAFLAAGVPTVVASLWPISDQPAVPLVTAFHRRLRNGEPPAAALRAAQLAALRSSQRDLQSPSAWASFQAFGG